MPSRPRTSRRDAMGIAASFLFFSLLFWAFPAKADYRLCNATSYALAGAIALQSDPADVHSEWHSQGWVRILPGACAPVLAGPIRAGSYHVFARSIEAHQGPVKYFSGNERFCTLPGDFAITGRENCAMRGYESNNFIRVETNSGDEWTTTFSEPRNYTLERARVAGVQRLLRDNGFRIARIDGIAAKATQRAIMAFQRAAGRQPTGMIDEALLGALIEGAEREHDRLGLDICNRTSHLAWAAIGVEAKEQGLSSGWIRIEPKACVKAVKGRLAPGGYSVYAEAVDEKGMIAKENGRALVWSGSETYCTKTTRFEIRGREACAARGYDEKKFMPIRTGGKARFDFALE